jgi:hypothetical protein
LASPWLVWAVGVWGVLLQGAAISGMAGSIVISGNESKLELTSGAASRVAPEGPDSLTILDFKSFPPRVTHVMGVPEHGDWTALQHCDHAGWKLALIANSLRMDPVNATNWFPESAIHLLDLESDPPRVIGEVTAGLQPSGSRSLGMGVGRWWRIVRRGRFRCLAFGGSR